MEQRLANLERAVAMLIAGMSDDPPEFYELAEAGLPIRFVFTVRQDDGGLDVSFEPA